MCRAHRTAALRLALEHCKRFLVGCSGCLGVLVSLTAPATVRAGLSILKSRYVCSWQTLVTNDAKQSSHSRKPPPKKKDGKGHGPSGSRVTGMSSLQNNSNAGTCEMQVLLSHDTYVHEDCPMFPTLWMKLFAAMQLLVVVVAEAGRHLLSEGCGRPLYVQASTQ